MRHAQNSPKMGFNPYLRSSVLEDVCICNCDIFEVPTSRSTTSSSNSSNNHTAIISSKLICFNKQIDLFIQQNPLWHRSSLSRGTQCQSNLSSRLFHREWSDDKGRTLDPNTDVPVTDNRAARPLCAGCGYLAG